MSRATAAALCVLAAVSVAACDDTATDPVDLAAPGAFDAWSKKRSGVRATLNGDVVQFEHDHSGMSDPLFDITYTVHRLVRDLRKVGSNLHTVRWIDYTTKSALSDQYNHSIGVKPLLVLRFDFAEALKYHPDRTSEFELINTATAKLLHPLGRRHIAAYCKDQVLEWSRTFCVRSLGL